VGRYVCSSDAQSTDQENGCQPAGGQEVASNVVHHPACSAVRYDCHTKKHSSTKLSSSLLDTHQLS